METRYQLITIGDNHSYISKIIETFIKRVEELGLSKNILSLITNANYTSDYKSNAPTVCIYFGENNGSIFPDLDILNELIEDAVYVLPVVNDLTNFSLNTPPVLHPINGFSLKKETDIDALVNRLMEVLSLLRESRRLFISYRRLESRIAAIQLYEHLDACGYDVFLDTHSIKPGEPFQDELWHRLVDTDVVLLLNTPGFFESRWTSEELAKASAMSIGVLQLVYPDHKPDQYASLCFPMYLEERHFAGKNYKSHDALFASEALKEIAHEVEVVRARSLAARQDNIIEEFTTSARKFGIPVSLQPEKFLTTQNKAGGEIAVIPTVGVPHAFTYNQTEDLIKRIKQNKSVEALLIYDHRNIREKWLNHLVWLDLYLPVKTIKITEVDEWMNKL